MPHSQDYKQNFKALLDLPIVKELLKQNNKLTKRNNKLSSRNKSLKNLIYSLPEFRNPCNCSSYHRYKNTTCPEEVVIKTEKKYTETNCQTEDNDIIILDTPIKEEIKYEIVEIDNDTKTVSLPSMEETIKLCINMDCQRYPDDWDFEEDTEETYQEDQWKKCCLCDGYFNDNGMGDILFVQEEPNNQEAGCSLCGKSEDVVQMKGTGEYLCGNACDEEEDEEEEDEDEEEEVSEEEEEESGEDEELSERLKEQEIDRISNGECPSISHDLYLSRLTSEQREVEKENDRLWGIRLKEMNIQHEKQAKQDEEEEEESGEEEEEEVEESGEEEEEEVEESGEEEEEESGEEEEVEESGEEEEEEVEASEEEEEEEVEASEEEEEEEVEASEEEEEEEEEEEVFETTIKGKDYYTTNLKNGSIYEIMPDEDIGDEVGNFVNGKAVFNK